MKKFLLILLGLSILFGCQEKTKPDKTHDQEVNPISTLKTTQTHFDTIIAQVSNQQLVWHTNIDNIMSDWEDLVGKGIGLTVSFDDYNIEVDNNIYYLTAVDDSNDLNSRVMLVLDNGNFYEASFINSPSSPFVGYDCSCTGCTSTGPDSSKECLPKHDENGWYCTDCSQGTCTKTVTAGVAGVLSNT